jgi:hypothetical protein
MFRAPLSTIQWEQQALRWQLLWGIARARAIGSIGSALTMERMKRRRLVNAMTNGHAKALQEVCYRDSEPEPLSYHRGSHSWRLDHLVANHHLP